MNYTLVKIFVILLHKKIFIFVCNNTGTRCGGKGPRVPYSIWRTLRWERSSCTIQYMAHVAVGKVLVDYIWRTSLLEMSSCTIYGEGRGGKGPSVPYMAHVAVGKVLVYHIWRTSRWKRSLCTIYGACN